MTNFTRVPNCSVRHAQIHESIVPNTVEDDFHMVFAHAAIIPNNLGFGNPNDRTFPHFSWGGILSGMEKGTNTDQSEKPFAEIGERLRWHRAFEGLDQEEYASKAGIKTKTYGNWETGYSRVSLNGAVALRKTYGLSIDFIVDGSPDALPATLFKAWRDRPSNK